MQRGKGDWEMELIDNTRIAQDQFGHLYGSEWIQVTVDQLQELLKGKQLAVTVNDEYVMFISMKEPV